MPIYEYRCPECGLKFELLRRMSRADEVVSCTRCGHSAERVLSTFACVSKGPGGESSPIGGSACSTCSATSCSTCH